VQFNFKNSNIGVVFMSAYVNKPYATKIMPSCIRMQLCHYLQMQCKVDLLACTNECILYLKCTLYLPTLLRSSCLFLSTIRNFILEFYMYLN
jgi:hypothetical protein